MEYNMKIIIIAISSLIFINNINAKTLKLDSNVDYITIDKSTKGKIDKSFSDFRNNINKILNDIKTPAAKLMPIVSSICNIAKKAAKDYIGYEYAYMPEFLKNTESDSSAIDKICDQERGDVQSMQRRDLACREILIGLHQELKKCPSGY